MQSTSNRFVAAALINVVTGPLKNDALAAGGFKSQGVELGARHVFESDVMASVLAASGA